MAFLDSQLVDEIITLALREDIGEGDISTDSLIGDSEQASAYIIAKEEGILAGLPVAERVFRRLDPKINWYVHKSDGDKVANGDLIVEFTGKLRAILTGERTALNFLQRMSGISTAAGKFADAVKEFNTRILDTRKTAPGQRMLDKYAVKMGGGTNHRIGLYDMVMIKDNHIKGAGSISNAVRIVREKTPPHIKIEVETTSLDEVKEALASGADIIMLDNMSIEMMKQAVEIINGRAKVEASGGVSFDKLKSIAATGVDFISVGALTHSVKALDLSQYIK